MRALRTKGGLRHRPIRVELCSRLESLPARVKRSANSDSFGTFGNEELCAWRVAPGVCRFQTTRPDFARKLSQRSGARLVAWSVNGGYLRVFEETIEPWRAQRLVRRYTTPTNGAFSSRFEPPARRNPAESITTAEDDK